MKNYYNILEVDKTASKEVIAKSYFTLKEKYEREIH